MTGLTRLLLPLLLLLGLGQLHDSAGETAAPQVALGSGTAHATQVLADGRPQVVRIAQPSPARPAVTRPVARAQTRAAQVGAATTRQAERPAVRREVTRTAAVAPAVPAASDAYPWARDTSGKADTWGFTRRQCVSYVAWRLEGRVTTAAGYGSALDWDETARAQGARAVSTPRVGAVAHWDAGESSRYWDAKGNPGRFTAGGYGHVAYVVQVLGDGSAVVAQYNGYGDRAFSTMRVAAPRYLLL